MLSRLAELFKRFNKEARAQKQAAVNAQLAKAVADLARRDVASTSSSQDSDPFASSLSSQSSVS